MARRDDSFSTTAVVMVQLLIDEQGSPSSFGMSKETNTFTKTD